MTGEKTNEKSCDRAGEAAFKMSGKMAATVIRRMESRDIPAVFQIQSNSTEAAQWSRTAYDNFCDGGSGNFALVTEGDGRLLGFLIARGVAQEMEILNLAVDPTARREGIGSALLSHALAHAAQAGVERVFLEVRASNLAAQRFYQAFGFASTGIRPCYYRNPAEPAMLLSASLRGICPE